MGADAEEGGEDAPRLRELLADPTLDVILLLSFLGGLGGGAASPALPGIAETFAVSDARIGLVMSAFTFGALVILPVSGVLMDAYGRRPVVLTLLFVFGLSGLAIAFVRSFEAILVLRFVQGVGFAGTIPLSIALVGDLYSGVSGSAAQGFRSSATGIARVVVPGVAGFLAGIAWYYPFYLNALALLAFVLVYRYLPETGDTSNGGTAPEAGGYLDAARDVVGGLVVEMRDPALVALLGSVFVLFLTRFTISTFVPLYAVQSLGASYFAAGVTLSLTGVGRFLFSPFAGSFAARVSRRTAFVSTIAIVAASILLVGVVDSILPLFATMLLFSVGDSLYNPLVNNAVTGTVADEYRARVVSVMEMLKTGAVTISPVIFGAVLALVGFERMFVAAGALSLLPVLPVAFAVDD